MTGTTSSDQEATLRPTSRFTVEREQGERAWHSRLFFDGAPTGRRIPGLRVEAQFSFGDRWLLLLDNDNESYGYLYISLLGPSLELVDQRELGTVWVLGIAGFVTNLKIVAPNALEFNFFNEHDCWRLAVLPSPRIMWIGEERPLARQWSKLFSRRWMTLDQVTRGHAAVGDRSADGPR
jgi:hypothetical protein